MGNTAIRNLNFYPQAGYQHSEKKTLADENVKEVYEVKECGQQK